LGVVYGQPIIGLTIQFAQQQQKYNTHLSFYITWDINMALFGLLLSTFYFFFSSKKCLKIKEAAKELDCLLLLFLEHYGNVLTFILILNRWLLIKKLVVNVLAMELNQPY
jgi:hypothetical protein